jgi:hypothetical protein
MITKISIIHKRLLMDQQEDYDAPYYHWKDFRAFYLDKLDKYDERRKKLSDK